MTFFRNSDIIISVRERKEKFEMLYLNYNARIASTDFDEMRAQYKDYLRSKCYSDRYINNLVSVFDVERWAEHYEWIYNKMNEIGVVIV